MRDGEYKTSAVAKIDMIGKKVVTQGKKPSPRYKHSAEVFKHYFIVHGGRNDQQFCKTLKSVALNDLHLLDIRNNTWTTVAIFANEIPDSRWGHSLVGTKNKLMLFGGMNLQYYCESSVFELIVDEPNSIHEYLKTKTESTRLPLAQIIAARDKARFTTMGDE